MAYRYRWDSPSTSPDDLAGVGLVASGQEFESEEPIEHPYAIPLDQKKPKPTTPPQE